MKVRDSGMPEQAYWESLLDVGAILNALGVDDRVQDVVELGCGYGTFTVPVARRIRGVLHAFDIEAAMVTETRARLAREGVRNAEVHERDVLAKEFSPPPASVDAVLLFNILHADDPVAMLRASAELLRPAGRVLVVHWRFDVITPRGPDLSIRPRPEQIIAWAEATGLLAPTGPAVILPPWHFGLALRRLRDANRPQSISTP